MHVGAQVVLVSRSDRRRPDAATHLPVGHGAGRDGWYRGEIDIAGVASGTRRANTEALESPYF